MATAIRRAQRKLYKTLGPPTFPMFMVAGGWILKNIGPHFPFIKFARSDRYTYHLPPVKSQAYQDFYKNIINRGLGRDWGPHAITMAITAQCNARCVHCSAYRRNPSDTLTTEQWCSVVDQCAAMGMTDLIITGGEPLLHPDLEVIVKRIVDNGCVADLFTNGSLLTEENLRMLKQAGCDTMFVSLDSPYAEEHDALRGVPGLYDTVTEGIRRAVDMDMCVGLSTYMGREQLRKDYHHKYLDLADELGIHEITIFDLVPTGKLIKNDDLILTDDERDEICRIHEGQWKNGKGPRVCYMAHVNNTSIMGCFGVKWQIHMTHNGYVTPCDFNPLHFGNVRDEPLADIWNRMKLHPEYDCKTMTCRMQDPEFRRKYIHNIPEGVELPYPIELIDPVWRELAEKGKDKLATA